MSKLSIYETNWIDLVFENRNKEYGAYNLRQESTKTTLLALFTGILFLTGAICVPIIYNYLNPQNRIISILPELPPIVLVDLKTYVLPKEETVIKKTVVPQLTNPITENTSIIDQLINPIIVESTITTPDIATNTEIKNTTDPNNNGAIATGLNPTVPTGTNSGVSNPGITESTIVSISALDKLPEFPGGINKFYNYVGTNFEKPEIELENAIRVNISFVVEKDGSMTDIKVIKDPGYGLGKEAIRVLKSLKTKWSPGMVDGKAVRTAYNLPITIQVN